MPERREGERIAGPTPQQRIAIGIDVPAELADRCAALARHLGFPPDVVLNHVAVHGLFLSLLARRGALMLLGFLACW